MHICFMKSTTVRTITNLSSCTLECKSKPRTIAVSSPLRVIVVRAAPSAKVALTVKLLASICRPSWLMIWKQVPTSPNLLYSNSLRALAKSPPAEPNRWGCSRAHQTRTKMLLFLICSEMGSSMMIWGVHRKFRVSNQRTWIPWATHNFLTTNSSVNLRLLSDLMKIKSWFPCLNPVPYQKPPIKYWMLPPFKTTIT